MKNKSTQLLRIKNKLLKDGFVTRNECLRQFPAITRLSAHILFLKQEGWGFETENRNGDYVYKVKVYPYRKETYRLEDGREIIKTVKI